MHGSHEESDEETIGGYKGNEDGHEAAEAPNILRFALGDLGFDLQQPG